MLLDAPSGRVTLVRLVENEKAPAPMLLTLLPRLTPVSLLPKERMVFDGGDAGGNRVGAVFASGRYWRRPQSGSC